MSWHENISNDPYDEYRPAPTGCRDTIIAVLVWVVLCVFCVFCVGCKSVPVPTNTRDSVRVEYKRDSIYVLKHDSIFRDRWRSGDTTYIVTEKWLTRYEDRVREIHDTLTATEVQYIKEKYIPAYYKNTSSGFWVLLVLLLVIVGWKIARYIIKIKTGI